MKDSKTIELSSEGRTETFEFLMAFEFEKKHYVALEVEPQTEEDEGSVAIFMVEKDENGEDVFSTISEENEAKRVWVYFISLWETEDEHSR